MLKLGLGTQLLIESAIKKGEKMTSIVKGAVSEAPYKTTDAISSKTLCRLMYRTGEEGEKEKTLREGLEGHQLTPRNQKRGLHKLKSYILIVGELAGARAETHARCGSDI